MEVKEEFRSPSGRMQVAFKCAIERELEEANAPEETEGAAASHGGA